MTKEDPKEFFEGRVAQKIIIEKDGKILISRNPNDPNIWEIPGGRLHKMEDPKEGLKRELMEELGVEVDIGDIFYTEQYVQSHDGAQMIMLAYESHMTNSDSFKLDKDEVAEVKWINRDEVNDQKIYDNCLNAINFYFESK